MVEIIPVNFVSEANIGAEQDEAAAGPKNAPGFAQAMEQTGFAFQMLEKIAGEDYLRDESGTSQGLETS